MSTLLSFDFFQNALVASIMVGIVCGFIGTYIVTRRLVFIAGGMAHASLGGVGLFALLGWSPLVGAGIFAAATGLSVERLSRKMEVREDSAIAMLWALGMSIGVVCSFMSPSFLPDFPNYLFGNILLTTRGDIAFLTLMTIVTSSFFISLLPKITSIAYDSGYAQSTGLPVKSVEKLVVVLIALSVVAVLKTLGIVLAICLLSVPQMTANLFARHFSTLIFLSIVFSVISNLCGLAISYYQNVPSGAAIVLTSVVLYIVCYAIKSTKSRFRKAK